MSRSLGGDAEVAAADLLGSVSEESNQLRLANNKCGIRVGGNHAQDAGHNAGDGIQIHGLGLTGGVLHGGLSDGPGFLNRLAVDIDVGAGGQLGEFRDQSLTVLEYHRHSEEAAEADGAFCPGGRGCGGSAALAGSGLHVHNFLGRIFLRNGGNRGIGLRGNVNVSAGVDDTVHGGNGIQRCHIQRQGNGNYTDGCDGGGSHIGLACQLGQAAGVDGAGGVQIRGGAGHGYHDGQGDPESLIRVVVGGNVNIRGAFRCHLAARGQGTRDSDFRQSDLNRNRVRDIHDARIQTENGLGLNDGCR